MLETEAKDDLQRINQNSSESFVSDRLFERDGASIKLTDLYQAYKEYCSETDARAESHIVFARQLRTRSDKYIIGRYGTTNTAHLGNYSFEKGPAMGERLILNDRERLTPASEVQARV